ADPTDSLRLQDLDDKVADRLGNFLEPMGHASGNDKHVSLGDAMRFATGDLRALPLSRRCDLPALHLAAEYECRLPVDDVEDIGLLVVHFDLPAGLAMAPGDEQVRPGHQRAPFRERCRDFRGVDMDASGATALRAREDADCEHIADISQS